MKRIAIVEDEAMYAKQLQEFLHQYEKENGECPVEKFIISLDIKMRAKMIGLLELLEEK